MITSRLTIDDLRNSERIFSEELEADPWVLFHGTSSMNASAIEKDGFRWNDALYTVDDLHRLMGICRSMNWEGGDDGSFSTLTACSLPRLVSDRTPAVYLDANPWNAAAFSVRRLAGGETLSSVIRVLDELRKYRVSSVVRRQHMIEQIHEYRAAQECGQSGTVLLVNLQWLDKQIQWINAFRERCMSYLKRYRYGVVYALQFAEADIEKMEDRRGSGICFHGTIPPERIVAKAKIVGLRSGTQLPHVPDRLGKSSWGYKRPDSLLGRLGEKVIRASSAVHNPIARNFNGEAYRDPEAAAAVQECDFSRWVKVPGDRA